MSEYTQLASQWLLYKEEERIAVEKRRNVESQLAQLLAIDESKEGTTNHEEGGFKTKVACRVTRSVNSDLLQEIAAEHGLTEHLSTLFRWRPEVSLKVWKNADEAITTPLLDAITTKPGSPSFTISIEE